MIEEIKNEQSVAPANELRITDILSLKEIQHMQDLFAEATGVASIITYPDGTPITKPSNFCRLCQLVRSTEKGLANCIKSDQHIGYTTDTVNESMLFPCLSAGLWDSGISVIVDGIHIANWMIGQVRNEELDENQIVEYALEIGVDKEAMREAFHEVPVMSVDKFKKVTEMLAVFANQLSMKAYHNHQLKLEIAERERINELLHKSEESLAITLHSIGDGVISTDKNGLIVDMNPIAEKLCGCLLTDSLGKPLTDVFRVVSSLIGQKIENPVQKVLATGSTIGLANHAVLISMSGTRYHISDSAAPIRSKDGEIVGVVIVFSDITESFKREELIHQSETRYRGLVNILNAGVVVHAPDTSIIMCNPKACELLGLTEDQIMGRTSMDENWRFLDELNRPMLIDDYPVSRIIHSKKPLVDVRIGVNRPFSNDVAWLVLNGYPVLSSNNEVIEVVISFIDITERKKAEDALLESEHYLQNSQEIAQLGTYTVDLNNNRWVSSPLLDAIVGIDSEYDKTIENWGAIVHPDWRKRVADNFSQISTGANKISDIIYKIVRPSDKQERWVRSRGDVEIDKDGLPVKIVGTIQDITDLKNAEEALKISEQKYRSIFENLQDIFFQIDMGGKIIEISPSVNFYSELERDDILGKSVIDFYSTESDRNLLLYELGQSGEIRDYELELKSKGGYRKHASVNARLVYVDDEPAYIEGFIRDVTRRKMIEKALKESETFLRETQFIAKLGTFNFDTLNNTWDGSDILNVILGIEINYNKTLAGWARIIHPEWFKEVSNYFKWKIKERKPLFDLKCKIVRASDGQERWIHTLGKIIYNEQGQVIRIIGTLQDITDRKQAKEALQESREQIKQFAAHLQSVREEEKLLLAREIHDELGQILVAMKIDLGMLRQKISKKSMSDNNDDLLADFEDLISLVDNTINATRKIMTDLRPDILDVLGFVAAVTQYIESFESRYKIACVFEKEIDQLILEPQQIVALYRILQEALTNVAKHAMATEVKVIIKQHDRKLVLQVIDNGIGFDVKLPSRHDSYGLLGIKERALLLDAEFIVNSNPGNGTTVSVKMPYALQTIKEYE